MKNSLLILSIFTFILTSSCSFGEKDDDTTNEIKRVAGEITGGNSPTIELVNTAVFSGPFVKPVDVHYGFDNLVYIADEQTNTVYQLDANGKILGTFTRIKAPTKIAMDRKLNIFVIGTHDTTIASVNYSFTALYYLEMNQRIISNETVIKKRFIHPFYIQGFQGRFDQSAQVKFVGITVFHDNSFSVARKGPENNSATRLGGYDNTVVQFDANLNYTGHLSNYINPEGTGLSAMDDPVSMTGYAVPPQSNAVSRSKDFLVGMKGNNFYRVQGFEFKETIDEAFYESKKTFLAQDTSKTNRFLFSFASRNGQLQSRFVNPADIVIAGDRNSFILVIDSALDSLYQFNLVGEEGISVFGKKNERVSFGGNGTGPKQFNNPQGVAYGGQKIFVADTGNRRIMVYKVSTDITR